MSERAEKMLEKAKRLRAANEKKASWAGDIADTNIPFARKRTKALQAEINAMGKIAEAMRLESDAAALLGEPDPHAPKVVSDEDVIAGKIAEAERLDADADLIEEANLRDDIDILRLSYQDRKRAAYLRREVAAMTGTEPEDPEPPFVSVFVRRLRQDADRDDATGREAVAAWKREVAEGLEDGRIEPGRLRVVKDR